jgi:N-acetylglucosamine-6-sulfatase
MHGRLDRRSFLQATLAGAGLLMGTPGNARAAGARPPNLVFFMTDDQAVDLLHGSERYPFLEMPNFARMQSEGVTFENAFVVTSLCSPSRATCLTGVHAHVHGVISNEHNDPAPEAPYLPALLQEAGYETAFIGKWHMEPGDHPRDGFDHWFSFKGQGEHFNPPVNRNGEAMRLEGYMTDLLTDEAVNWIRRDHEKPFCLFLWHKSLHGPFLPAPRHEGAYADVTLPKPPSWGDDFSDKPAWLRRMQRYGAHAKPYAENKDKPVPEALPRPEWKPEDHVDILQYLRMINAVDEGLGQVLDALEDERLLDNTAVLCTSDNGYILGDHNSGDKRVMWEPSIRIPLVMRLPGKAHAGNVVREQVLNMDFAPSLLDLAGVPVPDAMQGASFMPVVRGEKVEWRDAWLYAYFQEPYAPGFVDMTGVRTERWKYIHFPGQEGDVDELYDLREDPNEMNNLFSSPGHADTLLRMRELLVRELRKAGHPHAERVAAGA